MRLIPTGFHESNPYRFEIPSYRFEKEGNPLFKRIVRYSYRLESFGKNYRYNDMNEGFLFFNHEARMYENNPFTYEETAKLWVEFWARKGSLFLSGPSKLINKESITGKPMAKTEGTNLFFSINGFPKGRRLNSAVSGLNCFFLDIDLKGLGISKDEALLKMEPIMDAFDFITETRNGFHCFQLVSYGTDKESVGKYLQDRTECRTDFYNSTGIQPDPACKDIARIARIPGSRHVKEQSQAEFRVKLLKGFQLLKPSYHALAEINAIPILEVLKKIGISCQGTSLTEDGRLTGGWKANVDENYVNDFSNKGRPVGGPFAFVLHWHLKGLKGSGDMQKDRALAMMKTYSFFGEEFGISVGKSHKKTFDIPSKLLDAIIEANLPGAETKLLLGLAKLTKQEKGFHLGKEINISLISLLAASGIGLNITRGRRIFDSLMELIAKSETGIKSIFSLQISSDCKSDLMIKCLIMPEWGYMPSGHKSTFFVKSYVPIDVFILPNHGKIVWVWLYISTHLLFRKELSVLEIPKSFLCEKIGDSNPHRIKSRLRKFIPTIEIKPLLRKGSEIFCIHKI